VSAGFPRGRGLRPTVLLLRHGYEIRTVPIRGSCEAEQAEPDVRVNEYKP
jgi:hypothetical protein